MKRCDFKLLRTHTYLDSAAASLKPKQVVKAISKFYHYYSINPHSPESKTGVKIMQTIDATRKGVAKLLDCEADEVIFTSGTTDSLNKAAQMLAPLLKKGDQILLSPTNHASALVPFFVLAQKTGAKIIQHLDLLSKINERTKVIVLAQFDNTINNNVDIVKLYAQAKKYDAIVINDAAQAIAHTKVSLRQSDIIAFSANKFYGPTGIGVLAIKKHLLVQLKPVTFGGGATAKIVKNKWYGKGYIGDFEPGTPHTAGIFGLHAALKYLNKQNMKVLATKEKDLAHYAYEKLQTITNLKIYSLKGDLNILFNVGKYNAQDVVSYLGHHNVILRSGNHCAYLINDIISANSSIRLSISAYNNKKDIDKTVKLIKKGGDFLGFI